MVVPQIHMQRDNKSSKGDASNSNHRTITELRTHVQPYKTQYQPKGSVSLRWLLVFVRQTIKFLPLLLKVRLDKDCKTAGTKAGWNWVSIQEGCVPLWVVIVWKDTLKTKQRNNQCQIKHCHSPDMSGNTHAFHTPHITHLNSPPFNFVCLFVLLFVFCRDDHSFITRNWLWHSVVTGLLRGVEQGIVF